MRRSVLANFASAVRAGFSPSGSATVSPDWKLRSQRRPPTQVAEASCACIVGASARIRLSWPALGIGAGADHQRQVGHLVDRNAVEDDAVGIDQRQPAAGPATGPTGVRSTMSMTSVSGRRRETRASLTQPNCSSRSRIRGDVDQRLGGLGLARSRGRAAQFVDNDRVDQLAVHLLEADDLIAVDAEAGAADRLAGRERRLGGNVERDRGGAGHQHEETGERRARRACWPARCRAALCGSPRRRRLALRRVATRAASALPSPTPSFCRALPRSTARPAPRN